MTAGLRRGWGSQGCCTCGCRLQPVAAGRAHETALKASVRRVLQRLVAGAGPTMDDAHTLDGAGLRRSVLIQPRAPWLSYARRGLAGRRARSGPSETCLAAMCLSTASELWKPKHRPHALLWAAWLCRHAHPHASRRLSARAGSVLFCSVLFCSRNQGPMSQRSRAGRMSEEGWAARIMG